MPKLTLADLSPTLTLTILVRVFVKRCRSIATFNLTQITGKFEDWRFEFP